MSGERSETTHKEVPLTPKESTGKRPGTEITPDRSRRQAPLSVPENQLHHVIRRLDGSLDFV